MIAKDQPVVFSKHLIVGLSSAGDGNLKYLSEIPAEIKAVDQNRVSFMQKIGIHPSQAVLVKTTYDGEDYTRYKVVTRENCGEGITSDSMFNSDSLATNQAGVAIFLPVADCIAGFIYDQANKAFMVVHLGRQHTEQYGAAKSVEFMVNKFGSNPRDLVVWLGPSPSKDSYPLFAFENRSLHDVNTEHLMDAGVKTENITICNVDPSKDENYFSHSAYLKGQKDTDGRFAIVGMIPG